MNNHLTPALRRLAALTAACFAWSFVFAGAAQAATYKSPQDQGHHRLLSDMEMVRIIGSSPTPIGSDPVTGGGAGGNAASSPGAPFPWEGSAVGVKTGTGNKLTSIPIIGWTARGGLAVDLTLYHNSLSAFATGDSRGSKWTYSYDTAMVIGNTGNVKIAWGNGTIYVFTKNVDGSYTPPPGIHDHLVANGSSPISSFDLTTKSQIKFHLPYNSTVANYLLTTISDENGNTITVNRAANGGIISVTDPTNRTITFGANGGYVSSATDTAGHQWLFNYDGNGNLSQVAYPIINGTNYHVALGYDGNHNITSFTDKNGNVSTASFNSDSTTAWEQDPYGSRGSFAYYPGSTSGNGYTTVTDPNGHITTHTYASGVLASVTDALNYTEHYFYDTNNDVIQKQDKRGYYWSYTYDGMGNLLTAANPYGNTVTLTYNSHNRLLTAVTPLGRSAAISYDAADNPLQVQEKDSGGNVKATTTCAYAGGYGQVTSKTDTNNHKTLYGYDANGYLNLVQTPLGHQTLWAYDALGFQTTRTDSLSRTTAFTPDAWERRVTTTYPGGSTRTFTYDPNGNLTGFTNALVAMTRSYDADNRNLREFYNGTSILNHTYDAPGQKGLLSTTTDFLGNLHSLVYTARDQISQATIPGQTVSYAYDADGNQTGAVNPNGTQVAQSFDNAGRLAGVTNRNSGGGVLFAFGYTFNADGQRTGSTEADGSTYAWGYDGQGHLTSEVRSGGVAPVSNSYAYDGVGNRTAQSGTYINGTFSYDADDEMTAVTLSGTSYAAATFGYDADGQRTSEVTGQYPGFGGYATQFGYDYEGNLTGITAAGSSPVSFVYDGLDRQLGWQSGGARLDYQLDGDAPLTETGPAGSRANLYGNGLVSSGGETLLYDGLGAVRQKTDGGQGVVWSAAYQGFGQTITSGGSTGNAAGWGAGSGYRSDGFGPADATPLMKVGARYYDPQFGCFLTRDTDLSQKPYAYCDGDPVNFNDPTGHDSRGDALAGAGIVLGAMLIIALAPAEVLAAIPLGLLIVGGLVYAGIVGATANSITNAINEENKSGKSATGDVPEPQLPNPKGIGTVEQTTWTIYERGPDGSYWPKGTSNTNPGLPPLPPGAKTH